MSERRGFLLDTNILSETRKNRPEPRLIDFISNVDSSELYVSVLTLGELSKGIALKKRSDPVVADQLAIWADGLEYSFADRILGIDAPTARLWGELSADRSRPVIDTLLAATAMRHELTLVTRNVSDFEGICVHLLNPWELSV